MHILTRLRFGPILCKEFATSAMTKGKCRHQMRSSNVYDNNGKEVITNNNDDNIVGRLCWR